MTRRAFLRVGALGAIGLSLADYFAARAAGRVIKGVGARSAIMICNVGAPSQLDTFDMKPDAPSGIRGPFSPIRTVSPEIFISEILPLHARVADRFSLVRSCHHTGSLMHDAGWQQMKAGLADGNAMPEPLPILEIEPTWRQRHPTLRASVDATVRELETSCTMPLIGGAAHEAYQRVTSQRAREAFDLAREPKAVRERYGINRFGQRCLLARRLVEAGVRFVTVNTFDSVFDDITWDIHGTQPFSSFADLKDTVAPMYDKAYSALIEDLDDRRMLDSTLVCNLAEFGRTPRINAAGGRDHWTRCFTCYFAGGGVQGGRVIGRSDSMGAEPIDRPVEPAEIAATIFHSLGMNGQTSLGGAVGKREIGELF